MQDFLAMFLPLLAVIFLPVLIPLTVGVVGRVHDLIVALGRPATRLAESSS